MGRRKKDGKRATGIQAKHGFLYIVTKEKSIVDGKRTVKNKWHSTGLADTTDNVIKASELRNRILNNKNAVLVDRDITVADYADTYLEIKKRTLKDTTYATYRNRILKVREYFKNIKVRDLTVSDVEAFFDHLFNQMHYQPDSVKDAKRTFSNMMQLAVTDGIVLQNPVTNALINKTLSDQYSKEKNDDDTFFSYTEAQHFLEVAENHPLYELFYFTLFFGLRREEVIGIRWKSVQIREGGESTLTINHTVTVGTQINRLNTTKTDASARTYPLTDDQVRMFQILKNKEQHNRKLYGKEYVDNDYVFKHEDGSPYFPDYPSKAFKKVLKRAPELPQGITFHGLRTSCVSILVHMKKDIKAIQKWVGHANVDTTLKIYAKVKEKEAKQEMANDLKDVIRSKKYDE